MLGCGKYGRLIHAHLVNLTKIFPQRLRASVYSNKSGFESEDRKYQNALHRVVQLFRENDPRKIVVLAGAGISTASGIPDFRSPDSGLYSNLAQFNLPWPEAVFDLDYFNSNPAPFFALARELYPSGFYRPNRVHYFMKLLDIKSRLLRVYTQNIDGLERLAGLPPHRLVEAHGTFSSATCLSCGQKVSAKIVKGAIDQGEIPKCAECDGLVKPDVVFFGESLPPEFWNYTTDVPQADLLLVIGTSLEVQPFASIVDASLPQIPRVLFNRDAVGIFRQTQRTNDILILGDVQQSVARLVELLNWHKELDDLIEDGETNPSDYWGLHGSTEVQETPPVSVEVVPPPSSTSSITSITHTPINRYSTSTAPTDSYTNLVMSSIADVIHVDKGLSDQRGASILAHSAKQDANVMPRTSLELRNLRLYTPVETKDQLKSKVAAPDNPIPVRAEARLSKRLDSLTQGNLVGKRAELSVPSKQTSETVALFKSLQIDASSATSSGSSEAQRPEEDTSKNPLRRPANN